MRSIIYESMNQHEQCVLDALLYLLYRVKLDDVFSLDRMGTLSTICETPRLAHEMVLYGAQL